MAHFQPRKTSFVLGIALAISSALLTGSAFASAQILQTPLAGKAIPKYVEPMAVFGSSIHPRVPTAGSPTVSMEEFQHKILPQSFYAALPIPYSAGSYVWGYKVGAAPPHYPGFTLEAQKGVDATLTYVNNLAGTTGGPTILQKYLSVDQTLHWADPLNLMCVFDPANTACLKPYGNPNLVGPGNPLNPPGAPVPAVVHLHGAEVPSAFDGGPEQWFTPGTLPCQPPTATPSPGQAICGQGFVSNVFTYPNDQEATTLWFHDHALGTTRLNVYGGLAGFYLLRDSFDTGVPATGLNLPAGSREMEIVIQDRMFDTNGQLLFPDLGINPTVHPFWIPEFFGDAIVVNGNTWPFVQVEPQRYRLRLLNGSNARFYNLAVGDNRASAPLWQIGTDGGLLDAPALISWPSRLLLAPGERGDVIVDFSAFAGKTMILSNNAKAPFPAGTPPDPQTVGQIMQFRVNAAPVPPVADTSFNPAVTGATLRGGTGQPPAIVRLANPLTGTLAAGVTPDKVRQLTLNEVMGPGGPLEVLLNNTRWTGLKESTVGIPNVTPAPVAGSVLIQGNPANWLTELPQVGSTEVWEIINTTADAHPIHLHLVQFQIMNRQMFQGGKYMKAYTAAFPGGVYKPGDGPPYNYSNSTNPTIPTGSNIIGGNPNVTPYLQDGIKPPAPNEAGWKDTVVMFPGEVTRVVVRWAPQNIAVSGVSAGTNLYPFDPRAAMGTVDSFGFPGGPGYVWHCHILDHEDNEMMRPYMVQ